MSRSGYSDNLETWSMIRWRGAVASAIRGARGQDFLREMLEALDALPEKRLIAGDLVRQGEACALGTVAVKRGLDVTNVDPHDRETVAATFGIAPALAAEIVYENDESWGRQQPEERFARMRAWIVANLKKEVSP